MGIPAKYKAHIVALLLLGSATLLLSCRSEPVTIPNPETLLTQQSDTLTMIVTQNGLKQYRFETPLLESYELAREPYMEFRRGIFLETFRDSTEEIESTIIADYAIRYEKRAIWFARGNVVATGEDGRTLYTEQLYWDEKTERIYSYVDSKIVQGDDIFIGDGFESDDKLKNWTFKNYTGTLSVDASPNRDNPAQGEPGSDTVLPAAEVQSSAKPRGEVPQGTGPASSGGNRVMEIESSSRNSDNRTSTGWETAPTLSTGVESSGRSAGKPSAPAPAPPPPPSQRPSVHRDVEKIYEEAARPAPAAEADKEITRSRQN